MKIIDGGGEKCHKSTLMTVGSRRCAVKGFLRAVAVLGAVVTSLSGCSKSEKAMPITRENVTSYMQRVDSAVKGATQAEYMAARTDTAKQKELFYRSFVKPMNDMGYGYDRTIYAMTSKVLKKEMPVTDGQMAPLVGDMVVLARFTKEAAFKYGFISTDTKALLEKLNVAPVH